MHIMKLKCIYFIERVCTQHIYDVLAVICMGMGVSTIVPNPAAGNVIIGCTVKHHGGKIFLDRQTDPLHQLSCGTRAQINCTAYFC